MAVFNTESNVIKTFNVGLIVSMVVLFLLGIVTLISATKGPQIQGLFRSQLIFFTFGVLIIAGLVFVDTQILEKVSYVTYAMCLILLVLVLIIGKVGGGSQRWIGLGPIHLQPSEFAKIAIVFTLAKFFA